MLAEVTTRLIGRDDERARLVDALARCRAGHGGLVLISGEAGVGKSRLVAEVLSTLGYEDVAHLDGGLKAWRGDERPVVTPEA